MTDSRQQKVVHKNPQKNPGLWGDVLTEDNSFVCGLLGEEKKRVSYSVWTHGYFAFTNLRQCPATFWEDLFWEMGICGNGLVSTSVWSAGENKCVRSPREKTTYCWAAPSSLGRFKVANNPHNILKTCTDAALIAFPVLSDNPGDKEHMQAHTHTHLQDTVLS